MILQYKLTKSFNNAEFDSFCNDKLKTYEFFSDIVQPETLEYSKDNLSIFFKTHNIALIKPRFLKKGEGIFLLKKTDEFPELKDYLIQEFIDNGFEDFHFDIRVFVQNFDELIITSYVRVSKKLVSNIAQGGKVEDSKLFLKGLFPNKNKLEEVIIITQKIINKFDFKELGLDFVVDKSGKIFLIELNSFPGIAGLFILKNPNNSKFKNFEIIYSEDYKKKQKILLEKIRKNRYEELKCVE